MVVSRVNFTFLCIGACECAFVFLAFVIYKLSFRIMGFLFITVTV